MEKDKKKNLLQFAMETHCLRKNISVVQNSGTKGWTWFIKNLCSQVPLKLFIILSSDVNSKIRWVLPLQCSSRTDSQQVILRNTNTLIISFYEKKNYFSKLTAGFM